nr:hypothetical protein Iba_chr06eCG10880 [Ipomoea batatas]GMD65246.1 hypothetical protein Iba_chr12cCG3540 [Ipomoea batatas]
MIKSSNLFIIPMDSNLSRSCRLLRLYFLLDLVRQLRSYRACNMIHAFCCMDNNILKSTSRFLLVVL